MLLFYSFIHLSIYLFILTHTYYLFFFSLSISPSQLSLNLLGITQTSIISPSPCSPYLHPTPNLPNPNTHFPKLFLPTAYSTHSFLFSHISPLTLPFLLFSIPVSIRSPLPVPVSLLYLKSPRLMPFCLSSQPFLRFSSPVPTTTGSIPSFIQLLGDRMRWEGSGEVERRNRSHLSDGRTKLAREKMGRAKEDSLIESPR